VQQIGKLKLHTSFNDRRYYAGFGLEIGCLKSGMVMSQTEQPHLYLLETESSHEMKKDHDYNLTNVQG